MPNDPFYKSKDWWKLRAKVKAQWKREGKPCGMCKQPIDWTSGPICKEAHVTFFELFFTG